MKKLIRYFSVLSVVLFSSCADNFLDTQSPSKQSPGIIFNSLSLTEYAVNGIYNSLLNSVFTGDHILYWQGNNDIENTYRGFNIDAYKDVGVGGYGNYFNTPQNVQNKWENSYRTIEIATNAIEGIRNSPLMATDRTDMRSYLAEALTLRAMTYFQLVKFYGDIPFREGLASSDLSNVYKGRTDRDTIYHYIVKDLQEAVGYLPYLGGKVGKRTLSTPDRITKGYVKGLLARVALSAAGWSLRDGNTFPKDGTQIEKHPTISERNGFYTGRVLEPLRREYYEIAAQQCAEMIGDEGNPHHLDPSFVNIWKTVCKYEFNSSNENLYQYAYGMGQNGDVLGNLMGYGTAGGDKWGRRMNGGYCTSTAYYFYSFDKEDLRRNVTLVTANWTAENKEAISNNPTSINFGKWRIYWMTDAYLALNRVGTDGRVPNGIDWIDMRYSDVLLMFAEAMNELYGPDQVNQTAKMNARQALELVRERAFGAGNPKIKDYRGGSKDEFFEAVVNERAWEFGGENLRKSDLIRWGLLGENVEKMKLALCRLMADQDVQIFDKFYSSGTLPQSIYYKYTDKEYIDLASVDYYSRTVPQGANYLNAGWYISAKNVTNNAAGILLSSTGLNADAVNYDGFLSSLNIDQAGLDKINESLVPRLGFMGNDICNNRYLNPIYYTDINVSRGTLSNSYGF